MSQFCCFCLRLEVRSRPLKEISCFDKPFVDVTKSLIPEMRFPGASDGFSVCDECVTGLSGFYTFRRRCVENNEALMGFVETLRSEGADVGVTERVVEFVKAKNSTVVKNVKEESGSVSGGFDGGSRDGSSIETNFVDVNSFVEPADSSGNESHVEHRARDIEMKIEVRDDFSDLYSPTSCESTGQEEPRKLLKADTNVSATIKQENDPSDSTEPTTDNFIDVGKTDETGESGRSENDDDPLRSFRCEICNRSYPSSRKLKKHKSTHRDKSFRCDSCGKSFSFRSDLKKHASTHGEKSYGCETCGKTFHFPWHLKKHRASHGAEKSHRCGICAETFASLSVLKRHSATHAEKPYRCDVCGNAFTRSHSLKVHALIHTGEKPHRCEICGKTFTQRNHLRAHNLIHSGERTYECETCGKAFFRRDKLRLHSVVHTGEKPHGCETCGKTFSQLCYLKAHISTHSGEKPNKCDVCGKSFYRLDHLREHYVVHTEEKPYKCEVCGKTFVAMSTLKRHKLSHSTVK